jgi:hypothetical protein
MSSNFSDFVVAPTAVCVGIFAGLNVDRMRRRRYQQKTVIPPALQSGPGLPRQLGTGDRDRALTIESQLILAALSVPQYELHHIVTSSDQQNDQRDQCKAADEHRPVP